MKQRASVQQWDKRQELMSLYLQGDTEGVPDHGEITPYIPRIRQTGSTHTGDCPSGTPGILYPS
jgi:hypothetical protein